MGEIQKGSKAYGEEKLGRDGRMATEIGVPKIVLIKWTFWWEKLNNVFHSISTSLC